MATPHRFTWIIPDRLAGMAMPGYFAPQEADKEGLRALGVKHVVTLTEAPLPGGLEGHFSLHHWPVGDFGAPETTQVEAFCRLVDAASAKGEPVAVHCLAGIGRTGTFLAAYLMWSRGLKAAQALSEVRAKRAAYVQSVEQEDFLRDWQAVHPALPREGEA